MDAIIPTKWVSWARQHRYNWPTVDDDAREPVPHCHIEPVKQADSTYHDTKGHSVNRGYNFPGKSDRPVRNLEHYTDGQQSPVCVQKFPCRMCICWTQANGNIRVPLSGKRASEWFQYDDVRIIMTLFLRVLDRPGPLRAINLPPLQYSSALHCMNVSLPIYSLPKTFERAWKGGHNHEKSLPTEFY